MAAPASEYRTKGLLRCRRARLVPCLRRRLLPRSAAASVLVHRLVVSVVALVVTQAVGLPSRVRAVPYAVVAAPLACLHPWLRAAEVATRCCASRGHKVGRSYRNAYPPHRTAKRAHSRDLRWHHCLTICWSLDSIAVLVVPRPIFEWHFFDFSFWLFRWFSPGFLGSFFLIGFITSSSVIIIFRIVGTADCSCLWFPVSHSDFPNEWTRDKIVLLDLHTVRPVSHMYSSWFALNERNVFLEEVRPNEHS